MFEDEDMSVGGVTVSSEVEGISEDYDN